MTRTHYTVAEVAAMQGCSPRTVRARARRAGILVDLSCGGARPSHAIRADDLARFESASTRRVEPAAPRSTLTPREAARLVWST